MELLVLKNTVTVDIKLSGQPNIMVNVVEKRIHGVEDRPEEIIQNAAQEDRYKYRASSERPERNFCLGTFCPGFLLCLCCCTRTVSLGDSQEQRLMLHVSAGWRVPHQGTSAGDSLLSCTVTQGKAEGISCIHGGSIQQSGSSPPSQKYAWWIMVLHCLSPGLLGEAPGYAGRGQPRGSVRTEKVDLLPRCLDLSDEEASCL